MDIVRIPPVDEKEMAFAKCRLGGFGDVLKKRMEDFTVRVPIGASYYHFQKYLNDTRKTRSRRRSALPRIRVS